MFNSLSPQYIPIFLKYIVSFITFVTVETFAFICVILELQPVSSGLLRVGIVPLAPRAVFWTISGYSVNEQHLFERISSVLPKSLPRNGNISL